MEGGRGRGGKEEDQAVHREIHFQSSIKACETHPFRLTCFMNWLLKQKNCYNCIIIVVVVVIIIRSLGFILWQWHYLEYLRSCFPLRLRMLPTVRRRMTAAVPMAW